MALQTALYDIHAAAGATFTEFAGYDMPVHYGSIKEEHHAVRNSVGLFDVSHMSNLWVEGPAAADAIAAVTPKPAADLADGKGRYTVVLREDGTIVDDAFYFNLDGRFFFIPNAGQNQTVADHLAAHAPGEVLIEDATTAWSILALQGPNGREVLTAASSDPAPKFHAIVPMNIAGVECLVSGTGYTGEKGVELYVPRDGSAAVWNHLMACGQSHGIRPIGLGARDTLRLEKGYCLAGNEFEGGRTPIEAGLGWLIDWDHQFLGKLALEAQRARDHPQLVGLVQEKGIARHGYPVHRDGNEIGIVTSGTQSPTTGQGIALAYCDDVSLGETVQVMVRDRAMNAKVVKPPFVS